MNNSVNFSNSDYLIVEPSLNIYFNYNLSSNDNNEFNRSFNNNDFNESFNDLNSQVIVSNFSQTSVSTSDLNDY
jgi:hypothetical protein